MGGAGGADGEALAALGEVDAVGDRSGVIIGELAFDDGVIGLVYAEPRVGEFVGERAVVGE